MSSAGKFAILKTLVFTIATCATSCGPTPVPVPETVPNPVIGRIASVSPASKIVLIEKYGTGRLPEGNLFSSVSPDGSTASFQPTGEKIRNFHAADLLSGSPAPGDLVLTRNLDPLEGEATRDSENPPESAPGDPEVLKN